MNKISTLFFLLVVSCSALVAQSLDRPVIWASDDDHQEIISRINTYSWASRVKSQAKSVVDDEVNSHLYNPASILNTIPAFAADDNLSESAASSANSGHARATLYASYSAMLYYITKEEKYAQFSADIVSYYIDAMVDVDVDKMAACGNYFYDGRTTYAYFAIAYDFIYDFLIKDGTQVYNLSSRTKVDFDNEKAQRMIKKLASNALQEHSGSDPKYGKMVSNHPILTAPGVLFCIMAVDDDTERDRLFNVFWNTGTNKQNSFTKTILPMFGEQGVWPESLSYGFMPGITMVLNTVDRFKPEMNVTENYKYILEGNFLYDYLRMPSRYFVRYGDSKRKIDQTGTLYRYALDIASRRGYSDIEQKAKVALRQSYDATGGYSPSVSTSTFNACSAFPHLFWGVDVPAQVDSNIDFNKPTVIVKHAGVALQRNHSTTNNKQYGLCGIIGGAHYVHSHVTGIAMELYGQGYVMGPNAGLCASLADRSKPEHTDYFRLYAGNNTVIVNGTSHGIQPGSWKNDAYVWMNTTRNIAAEPKHLEDPISTKFSFATQFLDDQVNNCEQQRTLSTIRTSPTTAYYFDMFRSKSLDENKFHDYVYHNIGDEMHIKSDFDQDIPVTATTKYQTSYSDPVQSPGWRFFEDTKHTDTTDQAVNVRFDLNDFRKYMHVMTPAGVDRQYTKALGPATREGESGYLNKKTPILAIRQKGEAWNSPFVHVFEPSSYTSSSVKMTEHLYYNDMIVGAKISSQVGDRTIEDYVLCLPEATSSVSLAQYGISFTGHFAVVRYEQDQDDALTTLYIGDGESLSFANYELEGGAERKGVKEIAGEPYFGRQLLFKNLSNNDVIKKGSNLSVEAKVGEEFVEVSLWSGEVNIGTKTQAPYVWSGHAILTNMEDENYHFTLKAKDADGIEVTTSVVFTTPKQEPYTESGKPHPATDRIQFEYYDLGGNELGYYDLSEADDSEYAYRDSDLVDLGRNGSTVSYIEEGEWLEYTIEVAQGGIYQLFVNYRTEEDQFDAFSLIQPDLGDTLVDAFLARYTRNFSYERGGEFFLGSGKQVLRFAMLNPGAELDYFELKQISTKYQVISTSTNGTVTVSPDKAYYDNGEELTITATPNPGYTLKSWKGDYVGADNPVTITVDGKDVNLEAVFESTSAIDDNILESLEVYPNPSQGQFSIELADGDEATYALYTMNGTMLVSGQFVSKTQVNVDNSNAGVYLLQVTTDEGVDVRRVVID